MQKKILVLTTKTVLGSGFFLTQITGVLQRCGLIKNKDEIEIQTVGGSPHEIAKKWLTLKTDMVLYVGIKGCIIPELRKAIDLKAKNENIEINHTGLWIINPNLSEPGMEGVKLFREDDNIIEFYKKKAA